MNDAERTVLREKIFRKVALQTEQQLQAAATRFCDNVVDSFKAQTILFNQQTQEVRPAYDTPGKSLERFEEGQAARAAAIGGDVTTKGTDKCPPSEKQQQ